MKVTKKLNVIVNSSTGNITGSSITLILDNGKQASEPASEVNIAISIPDKDFFKHFSPGEKMTITIE